jgi:hypothetical protein
MSATMLVQVAARAVSILGHPALVVPTAAAFAAASRGAPPSVIGNAVAISAVMAAVVMGYSALQVRAGRWSHVDASAPAERANLNVFRIALLGIASALAWASGQPRGLVLGCASGAGIVAIAVVGRRWLKLSLHVGFAMFAACLVWPVRSATLLLLAVAAALAWSRVALGRHTAADVVAGGLAGTAVGIGFRAIVG